MKINTDGLDTVSTADVLQVLRNYIAARTAFDDATENLSKVSAIYFDDDEQ